jgi:hypothetical protein
MFKAPSNQTGVRDNGNGPKPANETFRRRRFLFKYGYISTIPGKRDKFKKILYDFS